MWGKDLRLLLFRQAAVLNARSLVQPAKRIKKIKRIKVWNGGREQQGRCKVCSAVCDQSGSCHTGVKTGRANEKKGSNGQGSNDRNSIQQDQRRGRNSEGDRRLPPRLQFTLKHVEIGGVARVHPPVDDTRVWAGRRPKTLGAGKNGANRTHAVTAFYSFYFFPFRPNHPNHNSTTLTHSHIAAPPAKEIIPSSGLDFLPFSSLSQPVLLSLSHSRRSVAIAPNKPPAVFPQRPSSPSREPIRN
jgi:hypothetical protein